MGSQRANKLFKIETRKDAGFPIKVETSEKVVFDILLGAYTQYIVAANNFVIAHFIDATSLASYMGYLKTYGFKQFPPKVLQILREQAHHEETKGNA